MDRLGEIAIYPLTWENYQCSSRANPFEAIGVRGNRASFGTGDRLGMVTAAHLATDGKYPIFPIIAQQSPRELERTDRTFKSVLLDAVMGVLESGWTGEWGADADHIKDEGRFIEGLDAGFSMYTLDVSEDLQSVEGLSDSQIAERRSELTDTSKQIIKDWVG